jgi:hypothetical protein
MAKFTNAIKTRWSKVKKRVGKIFRREPEIQEITPKRPARGVPAEGMFDLRLPHGSLH